MRINYMHGPPRASHLHLHHLVLALGAEGPLVGQRVVVVGALVAVQSDVITWQLNDLDTDGGNTSCWLPEEKIRHLDIFQDERDSSPQNQNYIFLLLLRSYLSV